MMAKTRKRTSRPAASKQTAIVARSSLPSSRPRRLFSGSDIIREFGDLKAGYKSTQDSRFMRKRSGYSASGSGADYHYASEREFLAIMEYARDLDRCDTIIGQTIDRCMDNTVRDGLRLDPNTGDKELDKDLTQRWKAWANDPDACDLSGEQTFHEMSALAFRQMLVDGDIVGIATEGGQVQMIEAHRIRTPRNTSQNVIHGVKLDANRKRVQYWITKEDINPGKVIQRVNQITAYPVRDDNGLRLIFHLYRPKRVSQTRGVSALSPIFDVAGMFEDINFARLVQAQAVSCFAIFRRRESDMMPGIAPAKGEQESNTRSDGSIQLTEGISPGMQIEGAPGEFLEGFSPHVPNPEFFPHVKLILTQIGINLGMPLVLLLMDASETNFSGYRGAMDQAKQGFQRNQMNLVRRWYMPTYRWKLAQWAADDTAIAHAEARTDIALADHDWQLPTWPYIQPYQDAAADLLRVRNGLISWRRLHAEHGRQWDQVAREQVEDNEFAILAAMERQAAIKERYPDADIHWRELISLPTPDGMTLSVQTGEGNGGSNGSGSRRNENGDDTGQSDGGGGRGK